MPIGHWKRAGHKNICFVATESKEDNHGSNCECWKIGPETVGFVELKRKTGEVTMLAGKPPPNAGQKKT